MNRVGSEISNNKKSSIMLLVVRIWLFVTVVKFAFAFLDIVVEMVSEAVVVPKVVRLVVVTDL